ncbi:hypothetical protein I1A62_04595 (plasmid) [Rhodococcus sp. USK10]|uniref:hypothetical protein n=1 Tax=Rhodococcus sp. USK10 TaxID=2789739 RepID=UPI001C5FEC0A|nr:hypothetical protein [Rhodococcus sp. USK10]QYB00316.1 hypothetical protein I1A62_04595 [Rhodococcus sp. USK10]
MTASTAAIAQNHIGQFVRRSNNYGFRTGQWAQIVMTIRSGGRDCWLVIYYDGETDVIPVDNPEDRYTFHTEAVDWRS